MEGINMASSTIAAVKQNEMKKAHRRQPNRSTAGKLRRRLQRAFNTPPKPGTQLTEKPKDCSAIAGMRGARREDRARAGRALGDCAEGNCEIDFVGREPAL
jgi:hypothetical protein